MRFIAVTLFLLAALAAFADEVTESRALAAAALEAHKAHDDATFLTKITAAAALRPQHSGLLYQLAIAQASNGRAGEANATLHRIAAMGFVFPAAKEPAFASPAFKSAIEALQRNESPIGKPATAMTFTELGQLTEGIAYDPGSGRMFVSSVRTRRIFDGKGNVFATGLPWGVFGLAVDAKRGVLWAASSAIEQMDGVTEADKGKAAVMKLDLKTGRVLATFTPDDADPHLFGDLTVAPNGDVYTTNSVSPVVYRVRGDRLEPFVRGPFASLQGVAVSRNGRTVYVADYAKGLFAIDETTRDVARLPVPDNVSLLGVDGIYLAAPGTLIATQNGTNPARVLRITLDGLRIASVKVLAANDPRMTDITLGTLRGNDFYFVANAQWEASAKREPVTILRLPVR